ncbi:hypothetical protein D3C72_1876690 [compost metagenome]
MPHHTFCARQWRFVLRVPASFLRKPAGRLPRSAYTSQIFLVILASTGERSSSAKEFHLPQRRFAARRNSGLEKGKPRGRKSNGFQEDAFGIGRCRMRSSADHRSCRHVGQKNRAFKQLRWQFLASGDADKLGQDHQTGGCRQTGCRRRRLHDRRKPGNRTGGADSEPHSSGL